MFAPTVNNLLLVAVVALVLGFGSSTALEAAFGLAVTATMMLTTLMIGYVVFFIWRWNPLWAVLLYVALLALDVALFAASATKFADGGWLPTSIAVLLTVVYMTWQTGRRLLAGHLAQQTMPVELFLKSTEQVHRVPATAIFLTTTRDGVPPALLHNLKPNMVRHERILLVTVETALTPRVKPAERITEELLGDAICRVTLRYGFAESPDVPEGLKAIEGGIDAHAIYFLSR